jgi:hypothetical protein
MAGRLERVGQPFVLYKKEKQKKRKNKKSLKVSPAT